MKVLIVGGNSTEVGEGQHMPQYEELFASGRPNDEVRFCYLDELVFTVSSTEFEVYDSHNNCSVDSYQLVIFRGKIRIFGRVAYALSLYLKAKNIRCLNDQLLYGMPSKLSQAIQMRQQGLVFPKTLAAEKPAALITAIQKSLTFPIILKDSNGAHGELNFLVKAPDEVTAVLQKHSDTSFVAQEFIPNSCDYRILVAGNKHLIIKRQSGSGHLHNTSQGGSASLVPESDFPAETIQQAHSFAKLLQRDIAGVDVMPNDQTGQMVFLEINSQPQILTGAFVAEKKRLIQDFMAEVIDTAA